MQITRPRILGWGLLVLVSLFWSSNTFLNLLPKQPDPRNLPSYPHAGDVRASSARLVGFVERATIAFQTADAPEVVLAFYRDQMLAAGWHRSPTTDSSLLRLALTSRGCPSYYVDIQARHAQPGRTDVEIQRSKALCR